MLLCVPIFSSQRSPLKEQAKDQVAQPHCAEHCRKPACSVLGRLGRVQRPLIAGLVN